MSESTPTPPDPTIPPADPARVPPQTPAVVLPPTKKRPRRWLRVVGVLLLLLVLLVVFAPTLAGLGFVRSIVVGQVNNNINGTVEIGDYSVGWFGGIDAHDVKVYDAQKNLILELNKFSTQLSLLDAARGKYALGDTQVDVDLTHAAIGDDGNLNYAKLAKEAEKTEKTKSEPKAEKSAAPATVLPPVTGKLTVNYKGAIYLEGNAQPLVTIQPSTAVINITDINQPIENDVTLKYSAAGGPVGTVHFLGKASAIKNNQLDVNNATGDEKLDLADVDLKALGAVLRIVAPTLKLEPAGTASGTLSVNAGGIDSLLADGQFKVSKLDVSGEPLQGGDRLQIADITVPIELSRTLKDGKPYIEVKHADVVLNGGQLGKITVVASAPQDALIQAAALVPAVAQRVLLGQQPSAETLTINGEGQAKITADLDVFAFAQQLKNTVAIQKGTVLTQGHLTHVTTIVLSKDAAKIDTDTKLPDLMGTSDGRPVHLSPIEVSAGLNAVGGANPDLRDLSLNFTSGFLNAKGGGPTLSQERLNGSFDLTKLQAEAAQFVDLDALLNAPAVLPTATQSTTNPLGTPVIPPHVQLAGTGSFEVGSAGDLLKDGGSAKTAANLIVSGINASGIGALPPLKLDGLSASVSGDLQRGAAGGPFVTGYKNVLITVLSTAGNAPVLDLAAGADLTLPLVTAPRFELTRLNVPDLQKVQEQFGAFVPALNALGLNIGGGRISATAAGSFDGKTVTFAKPFTFSASNLTVMKTDPATKTTTTLFDNETFQATAGGAVTLPQAQSGLNAKLSNLSITSSSGLFNLTKSQASDFSVSVSPGGAVMGNGGIAVSADLKKLNDVAQKFGGRLTASGPTIGDVQSGRLDGTLTLAHADQPQTTITFAGAITDLTVTTAQKPIQDETIKLSLNAVSPDDHSGMKADGGIDSRFLTAKLSNASVKLPGAKPVAVWDMLQHADVDVNVPDLPAVYSIINAFSPPTATPAPASADSPRSGWPEGPQFADASSSPGPILLAQDSTANETPEEAARRRKREKAAKAAKQAAAAPAAAEAASAAPLPPIQITNGSAALKLSINRDEASQTTTLNVTDMHASGLSLTRGDANKYTFPRDVTFKLAGSVKAADDKSKPSLVDQIQLVQVTQLSGDLGIAKLSMPQPISLANLGDPSKFTAQGAIGIDGKLDDATPLLAVLQASPTKLPYGGTYAVSQVLGTGSAAQGKLVRLNGGVGVTDFKVLDDTGKAVYTEPKINVKDDLDYIVGKNDPATNKKDYDQAIVRALSVDMPSSQALLINFSGRVLDPMARRVIKGTGGAETARLDVTYDLEKIWPIIEPMLAADIQEKYKTLKVTGKEQKTFTVSGAFPAAATTAMSMRHINADGDLALEELDLPQGLKLTNFDLVYKIVNGVLTTSVSQNPLATASAKPAAKTAIANDGVVDLSEITLDLGQASPILSIAKNHKLLQGVHVNPVLADSLGAGNMLFKDATQATGLLDVTVIECSNVPLGDLIAHRPDAHATIVYSLSDVAIDGPAPTAISNVLSLGGQGLHGGIKNGKLTLANGEVSNDFAFDIIRYTKPAVGAGANQPTQSDLTANQTYPSAVDDQGNQLVPVVMPLRFTGGVDLASAALKGFAITIPGALLDPALKKIDKSLVGAFPDGATLPFSGTTSSPKLDFSKFVQQNAAKGLLNKVTGGGGGGSNPAAGLGDLFKKKKKTNPDSGGSGQ